ncbi:hypothetical protein [Kutzneria kofuensis]|uniref:hypothetical protein n=1 Tax=Kutzneria kofuensis TaxID=103725 RepID=UPI0031E8FB04
MCERPTLERPRVVPTITPGGAKVWLVTGYQDVRAGLSDPRLSRDTRAAGHVIDGDIDGQALRGLPMGVAEPLLRTENAARLRRLAATVFTAERVEPLRPRIAGLAAELLAPLRNQRSVDLVAEVARPLPVLLTCGLLGLPMEDKTRSWTEVCSPSTNGPVPRCGATSGRSPTATSSRRWRRSRRPTTSC